MSYLDFLLQWYNWPYLAALLLALLSFMRLEPAIAVGDWLGRWLRVEGAAGRVLARVFGVAVGVVGLTVNGALHDYWPAQQERGFLPGLLVTALLAAAVTRGVGRLFERHFPEIKAVGWGATDLAGREARVVSRKVSPDYRAGRAQVMEEDGTLHMVLCKTREEELLYGALVVLTEYDVEDRRYYVQRADAKSGRAEGVELYPGS
ncbi:MAG: DUF1449 family protein [Gemmatimonadetes bacterium]|uniref:DUF1449 family protein n=1 Tax=Candidatus Kutchimonas denitrificans TaxID=3056748 RepID=A0AAE4Z7I4_9BACT|nr:DUF1449 family protein [Gemmatimonadota bacterium]NIR75204.1 DUF1449 family protein [Candidatus Kutchimonas denitrificans]NIS00142.1 DUF1449 family protein [Gemmatimonadota bacterium]NIT65734.1 DUF1449 family protein [Gemmatimonadota bacterium]NIU53012.1 DUF1449 family protein [Gemmatimonadota bacterium]